MLVTTTAMTTTTFPGARISVLAAPASLARLRRADGATVRTATIAAVAGDTPAFGASRPVELAPSPPPV